MPPRKSTTRNASSTPARQTRAASSSRTTRATPGPSAADIVNPQLPEIQTQQSFAYGSTKTPLLPKALQVRSKMTTAQMAQTLDEEINQAEANLRAHVAETTAYRRDPVEERRERARRRSASRDSREPSVVSETSEISRHTRRSTNESDSGQQNRKTTAFETPSQLEPIDEDLSEEESELISETSGLDSDDADASPTPSLPDWTYIREGRHHSTGIFATMRNVLTPQRNRVVPNAHVNQRPRQPAANLGRELANHISNVILALFRWIHSISILLRQNFRCAVDSIYAQRYRLWYGSAYVAGRLFGLLCKLAIAAVFALLFLFIYANAGDAMSYLRNRTPSIGGLGSALHLTRGLPPVINLSEVAIPREVKVSMDSFYARLLTVESQSSDTMAKIGRLIQQQKAQTEKGSEFENKLDELMSQVSSMQLPKQLSSAPSQINYFSPGNGAIIDPFLTSPTKAKQFTIAQKVVLSVLGRYSRYQSLPPFAVLQSWEEQGDCWCAATGPDLFAQLVVLLGYTITPEEIVVEHPFSSALTTPGNTPKDMELWARDHLKSDTDEVKLGPGWTRIATFRYEAPTKPYLRNHIQTFKIPPLMRPTNRLAVRVLSNYGGDDTCLYRIKVHGRPVEAHQIIEQPDDAVKVDDGIA